MVGDIEGWTFRFVDFRRGSLVGRGNGQNPSPSRCDDAVTQEQHTSLFFLRHYMNSQ